jgi:hypothetical protein
MLPVTNRESTGNRILNTALRQLELRYTRRFKRVYKKYGRLVTGLALLSAFAFVLLKLHVRVGAIMQGTSLGQHLNVTALRS